MEIEDYDEVISLWKLCEGVGLSSADTRKSIDSYLKRNPHFSYIARDRSILIAAALCGHDGRRGFTHHLAVHPVFQRKGIGRLLVENCLKQLNKAGIQKCHLFVFSENESAIFFWKEQKWIERTELNIMSRNIE